MVKLFKDKIYGVNSLDERLINLFQTKGLNVYIDVTNEMNYQELKEFKRKNKKEKYVVIFDNDLDFLYEVSDYMFLIEDKIYFDTCSNLFETDFITQLKNKPTIPYIVYLAREKNIFLQYNKEVKDLVKDIYKWVKKS